MPRVKIAALLSGLMMLASASLVSAQQVAYGTPFATSITYQNVGTATAQVSFSFYNEKTGTPVQVNRDIAQNAGDSLFVGGLTGGEALPSAFKGSAVLSANQPIVATLVQIAQPSATTQVKNRPLSNGFSSASSEVLLATVLKNKFNFNSVFSIQNADTAPIDITLRFINADDPNAADVTITETNIPVGAAKYYDMGQLAQLPNVFNGSAEVTAVRTGTTTPANIVGSSIEQETTGLDTYAFEGVSDSSNQVFVATALCDVFGGARTSYAVQNDGTAATDVTVSYAGIDNVSKAPVTGSDTKNIAPGAKASFVACDDDVIGANFTGAATISADQPLVVIAKVFGGTRATAWLGEAQGSDVLALPYVRYSDDTNFNSGKYQRAFIAIQNVGTAAVSGVTVEYRDKNGNIVGTDALDSIAVGAKANSNATTATPASGFDANDLLLFGNPESNPGGGFGGGAIVRGPAGSQLIAVVRVESSTSAGTVAEDYNGIPIQ
jgi:hypothetical protein